MRHATSALLLVGCSVGELPVAGPPITLQTEPTVGVDATTVIENRWRRTDLIVGDIQFRPSDLPARWSGAGPWTIEPGDTRSVVVRFEPVEEGSWAGDLVFTTDVGDVTVPVSLIAEIGEDSDGDGFSAAMGDCDDDDASAYPGAAEICDGDDEDCDDVIDEGFDFDGDGHLDGDACAAVGGDDCNDQDATAHPGHAEECDLSDSDCNGIIDDIDVLADRQWGPCAGLRKVCRPGGPIEPDYAAVVDGFQWIETACDAVDNDCDGGTDDFDHLGDGTLDCVDDDGDGEREVDGDCDDLDATVTSATCGPGSVLVTQGAGYTVIDLDVDVATTIDLGTVLYDALAVSASTAFVTDRFGLVAELDLDSAALTDGVTLSTTTWSIAGDATAFYVNTGSGAIVSFPGEATPSDQYPLGGDGTGLTQDVDGTLWACTSDGLVHHLDPAAAIETSIEVGGACYGDPIVDEAADEIIVLDYDGGLATRIDRSTETIVDQVDLGGPAVQGALAGDVLYVATGASGEVLAVDIATWTVTETWPMDGHVSDVYWDAARGVLWVAVYGADEVIRLDPSDGTALSTHPVEAPTLISPVPRD